MSRSQNYQRILNAPIKGVGVRISEARRSHYYSGIATAGYVAQANETVTSDPAGCHDPQPRRKLTPEQRLALAMIEQGYHDLTGMVDRHEDMPEGSRVNAVHWFNSHDRTWPLSFQNCCDLIALDADNIRASLNRRGLLGVGHGTMLRLVRGTRKIRA